MVAERLRRIGDAVEETDAVRGGAARPLDVRTPGAVDGQVRRQDQADGQWQSGEGGESLPPPVRSCWWRRARLTVH